MDLSTLPLKKIAIGVAIAAIATGAGFGIYYLFFKAPAEEAPIPSEPTIPGGLPAVPGETPAGQVIQPGEEGALPVTPTAAVTKIEAPVTPSTIARGGVTKVTINHANNVLSASVAQGQTNPFIYNRQDGFFYEINPFGTLTKISNISYPNVENVSWDPKGNQAILEFPDGTNILYDFKTKKQSTLPKSWQDFTFNGDGTKIAFKDINLNLDYNWLAIANPDGSAQKYIEPLLDKSARVEPNWSASGHVVATYYKAKDSTTTSIYLIGQNNENFQTIEAKGFGVQAMWVPDGKRMIYNSYDAESDNKPVLHIVDAYGDRIGYNNNSLNLNTWIDKCTFQGAGTMYCAVPKYLSENAGFQPSIANDIPDYIYKIDLNSGAKTILAEPELAYTIDSMNVSQDGKYLYFKDKNTGSLNYIQLK
ncbi:MAG: hypothetical protein ACOZBH_03575 [Patescibacteria group bacterium]